MRGARARRPGGPAGRRLRGALPLAAPLVLGAVVGALWWRAAPTAPVQELPGGTLVALRVPELAVAQDGVLALAGAGAGLLCGLVAALLPGRAPVRRSLAVLAGSAAGSALAWRLGALLGPAPVAAQRAAGAGSPGGAELVSPLAVHSPGVLLVWPLAAALVMAAAHLVAAWTSSGHLRGDGADGRHQAPGEAPGEATGQGAGREAGPAGGAPEPVSPAGRPPGP